MPTVPSAGGRWWLSRLQRGMSTPTVRAASPTICRIKGGLKMRGSIIKRSEDSYRIKVSLGKDSVTGKYTAHYETVQGNKAKAEKRLRELLTEFDKGTFIRPGKATLSEYLKSRLLDYCKPNLAGNTLALYSIMCDKHINPTLGNIPLLELKPQHLQHLYAQKLSSGLSARTVQIIHITLHKAPKCVMK